MCSPPRRLFVRGKLTSVCLRVLAWCGVQILAENSGYDAQEVIIKLQVRTWGDLAPRCLPTRGALGAAVCTCHQQLFARARCTCVQEEHERGSVVGLDVATGEPFDPTLGGVLDNYIVKKQVRTCGRVLSWRAAGALFWSGASALRGMPLSCGCARGRCGARR